MTWLSLALLAAGIESCIGVIDKVLIERCFRDAWTFTFFVSLFLGGYSACILLVRGSIGQFHVPPWPILVIGVLPGVFMFLSSLFYSRSLLRADASTVAAINQTVPVFALIWGGAFFGNWFTPLTYLGVGLVVVCCALLGMAQAPGEHHLRLDPVVGLILVGALLRSLADLSIKLTLTGTDYWNALGMSRSVQVVIAMIMLATPSYRRILRHGLKLNGRRIIVKMAAYEGFVMVPLLLSVMAYSQGPLALVSAILYSKPFFVLLLTFFLNRLRPGLVPERASGQSLFRRGALILGVVSGVVMLSS